MRCFILNSNYYPVTYFNLDLNYHSVMCFIVDSNCHLVMCLISKFIPPPYDIFNWSSYYHPVIYLIGIHTATLY